MPLALTAIVLVAGFLVLLARPALLPAGRDPTAALVMLFVLLGLVGAMWPLPAAPTAALPHRWAGVVAFAVGSLAFAVGRLASGGPLLAARPALFSVFVLNALAAIAEEAFFRRLLFGALLRFGSAVAVIGSAAAFALAHVSVWGLWVLPLDLAAGLLLSWQRAVSGRWSVPAATHVLANTLALL